MSSSICIITIFKDALAEIRKTNPTRAVLMGTDPWGGLAGVPDLVFPDDNYIILTIHYYEPFSFTHQGAEWVNGADAWLGTKWENTTLERDEVASSFAFVKALAKNGARVLEFLTPRPINTLPPCLMPC